MAARINLSVVASAPWVFAAFTSMEDAMGISVLRAVACVAIVLAAAAIGAVIAAAGPAWSIAGASKATVAFCQAAGGAAFGLEAGGTLAGLWWLCGFPFPTRRVGDPPSWSVIESETLVVIDSAQPLRLSGASDLDIPDVVNLFEKRTHHRVG